MSDLEYWTNWLWSWVDWVWAAGWILAGILGTHLLWWQRHNRLAERERQVREQLAHLESRNRENLRQTENLGRREAVVRKMEESLRAQTEQLMPQIEQVRGWLDQLTHRKQETGNSPPPVHLVPSGRGAPERAHPSLQ